MLDQRGTGRSTPVGALSGMSAEEQALPRLLSADSIVKDAEFIRSELGVERWSVLGQSFGGFCVLHYMSAAPGGLAEAFLTGGLPPVGRHPDEVYAPPLPGRCSAVVATTSATRPTASGCAGYTAGWPRRRSCYRAGTGSPGECSASSAGCSDERRR